jgi:hypothetical protein
MAGPFKMKGSPFQRNFGIGSPLHHDQIKRKVYRKDGSVKKIKYQKHKHDENNPDPDKVEVKKEKTPAPPGEKKVEEKKLTFNEAFSNAKKSGKTTFTWNGKSYNTKTKDEASQVEQDEIHGPRVPLRPR